MMQFDVVVIGAGAAGLFCAGVAGQRGLKVLVLDHSEKVAEKVRISGGGRANFTNRDIDVRQPHKHFVSENPNFCRSALSRYTPQDFIALVQQHGIAFHEKHKGQLFCDRSAEDLITAPAHVVIRAADVFRDKTTRPNELWQTDFTYLKVIGWGWFYLSTILDDYSRYIIAWKLCTTMKAADVTDKLELALDASGCNQATVAQKPRLLSDNGSSYVAADLAEYLEDKGMDHVRGAPNHPQTQGKIPSRDISCANTLLGSGTLAPDYEEPRAVGKLLPAWRS